MSLFESDLYVAYVMGVLCFTAMLGSRPGLRRYDYLAIVLMSTFWPITVLVLVFTLIFRRTQ